MKYFHILVSERKVTAQLQVDWAIKHMPAEYASDVLGFERETSYERFPRQLNHL